MFHKLQPPSHDWKQKRFRLQFPAEMHVGSKKTQLHTHSLPATCLFLSLKPCGLQVNSTLPSTTITCLYVFNIVLYGPFLHQLMHNGYFFLYRLYKREFFFGRKEDRIPTEWKSMTKCLLEYFLYRDS